MKSIRNKPLPAKHLFLALILFANAPAAPESTAQSPTGKLNSLREAAKADADEAVEEYRKLKKDEATPKPVLNKAKQDATELIKRSLKTDLEFQQAKIERARERLQSLEAQVERSTMLLEQLARKEFQRLVVNEATPPSPKFPTPESVLKYFYEASESAPKRIAVECMTDEAVEELSGLFLQSFSLSSAMMQLGAKAAGDDDNELQAMITLFEAHLQKHVLDSPPEAASRAFETLVQTTVGLTLAPAQTEGTIDSALLRSAAGILKSPRDFLNDYMNFMNGLGGHSDESEDNHVPDWEIEIDDTDAIARDRNANQSPQNQLTSTEIRLTRKDGNWLISGLFTDESLGKIQNAYSQSGIVSSSSVPTPEPQFPTSPDSRSVPAAPTSSPYAPDTTTPSNAIRSNVVPSIAVPQPATVAPSSPALSSPYQSPYPTSPPTEAPFYGQPVGDSSFEHQGTAWQDLEALIPELGVVLVMIEDDGETSSRMKTVAKAVADGEEIELLIQPFSRWRYLFQSPGPHFVAFKDRQLMGTRSGLITRSRLAKLIEESRSKLTPEKIGLDPRCLVRIDCYINPGPTRIGSQQGGSTSLTGLVVAQEGDRTLVIAPDGVANYQADGYMCLVAIRDESGKTVHYPFDTLIDGRLTLRDDGPETDCGSCVLVVEGLPPLPPAEIASANEKLSEGAQVLSGSHWVTSNIPPVQRYEVDTYWQSGSVIAVESSQYHDLNGPKLIDVSIGRMPPAIGFTFNKQGECIGRYALGGISDSEDRSFTVFSASTTRRILTEAARLLGEDALADQVRERLVEKPKPLPRSRRSRKFP